MDKEHHNIDDLQRRIAELKQNSGIPDLSKPESDEPEKTDEKGGLSAAYELIMTPIVCGAMGLGLDKLFSTAPTFFIILAILGVLAGFWRIYRVSQNIHTPLELKRLQDGQKQGRKAQISDINTE